MSVFHSIFGSPKATPTGGGGETRRLQPVSRVFGLDRGQPLDRYYIEKFLAAHQGDIQGRVLEIASADYTRQFGGRRVTRSEVLHAETGNPHATLVGDLATGQGLPPSAFDCIILTQTLQMIYDHAAAVQHAAASLKPGGVLLATLPGISQVSRYDMDRWGDYWRYTDASAKRLFGDLFGAANVAVTAYGNVAVACAFLQGLATQELKPEDLDYQDPDYPVLITVRAVNGKGD